ncbi:MAG TPA: ATP-dependent DNA helicase RecG [Gammaproteobacteria bacterium]|nr:ATP-dependent DNA helicase RecG [Gammaproteobacteria bacterium]
MLKDSTLGAPVTSLKGVGPSIAKKLEKLNISTVGDLLFHLPIRYQDRTRVVPIGSLRPGDEAVIEGEVLLTEIAYRKRRMLLCRIADGSGSITLRFFHFSETQKQALARGVRLRCFGEARLATGGLEMIHPEYRHINDGVHAVAEHLTPFYPATEGISQLKLRDLTAQALQRLGSGSPAELLPESALVQLRLPTLAESLRYVHRPPPEAPVAELEQGLHPAQQRLAFEELLAHHLALRELRRKAQSETAPEIRAGARREKFLQSLPFSLTAAQAKVIAEIDADLRQPKPMLRLVQGDVGSGKTVVAATAALAAAESGAQAALMAPTELLAEQHLKNFRKWLEPLGCRIGWLSSKLKGRDKNAMLHALADHEVDIAVGTHALFQEDVAFAKLGLLIVDEQHRFGVHQRLSLRDKGVAGAQHPHQLTMTATPIPRSLAMTAYADLDYSVLDELPPGRLPVNTVVVADARRDEIVQRIEKACRAGQQAYWVCTLIEESEMLQCQAAENTAQALQQALPGLRIALLHGRLKAEQKETIMRAFAGGELDLLVATTVIEVGVDVPNASLMIIENAERLGLAQLHQLRGRVGRGAVASHCVLMYRAPLSERARQRLELMRQTNDGFVIAQKDLEMRGPGELLGTRQAGMIDFRIADLARDNGLLPAVQRAAALILQDYPQCVQTLVDRWIGNKQQFRRA